MAHTVYAAELVGINKAFNQLFNRLIHYGPYTEAESTP
jgi:hypothetical protein